MSLKLALIDKNAPINKEIGELEYTGINRESTLSLFRELEFDKLIKRLSLLEASGKAEYSFEYKECEAPNLVSLQDGELTSLFHSARSRRRGLRFCQTRRNKT